jgi:hypothetical protein
MTSLTLINENQYDDVYATNIHTDNIFSDQTGSIIIQDPVFIGNSTLEQHIRNQITTTGALTYNASTGRIQGIVLDNYNRDITLSLTGDYILSGNLSSGTSQSLILYFNYSDGNKLGIQPNTSPLITRTINLSSLQTQLVDTFSITKAELNQDFIWAGVVDMNVFVSSSVLNETALFCEAIYFDGFTETILVTTDILDIPAVFPAVGQLDPSAVIQTTQPMAVGSEYRIKIYVRNLSTSPRNAYVYYQDTFYSHTHTTFNLASFLANYYTKTETDTLLNTKQNGLTFNSPLVYTAGTGELGLSSGATSKWFQVGNDIANINATGNVEVLNTMDVLGKFTTFGGIHAEFGSTVGMNTPPPTSGDILDVNGTSLFRNTVKISSGGASITGNTLMNGGLHITGGTSMNGSLYVRDSVAIGLTGTVNALHVQSSNAPTAFAIGTTNTSFTQIGVAFANGQFSNGARAGDTTIRTTGGTAIHIQNGFTISALTVSGNLVGIGTKNPTAGLTVSGNVDISGAVSISGLLTVTGGLILTGGATLNHGISIVGGASITGNTFITGRLHITGGVSMNGNLRVNGDASVNKLFVGNSSLSTNTNDLFINAGTISQDIWVRPNGDGSAVGQSRFNPTLTSIQGGAVQINSTNQVGIDKAPSFKMDVNGDVNVSTGSMYKINGVNLSTTNITEGTNLYYLDSRARASISASSPLSYDNSTGIMSISTAGASKWTDDGTRLTTTNPRRVRVGSSGTNTAIIELTTNTNTHFIFNSKEAGTDGCLIARVANQAPILLADNATTNAQIGIGLGTGVVPDTNCIIHGKKTTGGIKAKIETGGASDAELILKNSTGEYAWYSHNSASSMRLYNYGTSSDLLTVLNNGNVGIGTNNPTVQLQIEASFNSALTQTIRNLSTGTDSHSALRLTNDLGTSAVVMFLNGSNRTADGGTGNATLRNNIGDLNLHSSGARGIHIQRTTGRVGIATTGPSSNLSVSGNVDIVTNETNGVGMILQTNVAGSMNRMVFGQTGSVNSIQSENQAFGGGPWNTQSLLLNRAGGNIGIGMNNPQSPLDIASHLTTRAVSGTGVIRMISSGGANFIQSGETYTSGSVAPLVFSTINNAVEWARINTVGNMGIATSAPQARFHVKGRTRIETLGAGDTSAVIEFVPNGRPTNFLFVNTADVLVSTASFSTNGTVSCILSLIAGSTAVYHNANNTLSVIVSDIRTKKDIVPLDDAETEELFGSLEPVEYFFKIPESNPFDVRDPERKQRRKYIGFIANRLHPRIQSIIPDYRHSPCETCIAHETHPKDCDCDLPECSCNTPERRGETFNYIDREIIGLLTAKVKLEERKTKKLQQDYNSLYDTMVKERIQYKVMEDKQNSRIRKLEGEVSTLKYTMEKLLAQLAFKGITIKL